MVNIEMKGSKGMWPSLESASSIYDWANWFLLGALAVGVVSTGLVIWMGNVKETYLRREVSEARLETEQLKGKYAWRRIDPTKFSELIADLKPMATLIAVSSFSDPESSSYADDISKALNDAGFNVRRQYFTSAPAYDLTLSWPSDKATALRIVFKNADVPIEISASHNCGLPSMPDGRSWWDLSFPVICVGLRPRPSL